MDRLHEAHPRTEEAPKLAWLLGPDKARRLVIARWLVTVVVYAFSIALQWFAVWAGFAAAAPAFWLSLGIVVGLGLCYAAIRSGWSTRLDDPALGLAQSGFAAVCLAWAYAHNPLTRGSILMVLVLMVVFGAYMLPRGQIRAAAVVALALIGAAMAWKSHDTPALYPPLVELIHFLFLSAVVVAASHVAGDVSHLRLRGKEQRKELQDALARISELATRDELTGLHNRRHLRQLLEESATARCAIAIVDLDHFKSINDRYGHGVGDEVLRAVATALRTHLRLGDAIGRWGGEEFLVLLPHANDEEARDALDRVRQGLAQSSFRGPAPNVTFSAGVTTHRRDEDIALTIDRADRALYRAKERGRDQTVLGSIHPRPLAA